MTRRSHAPQADRGYLWPNPANTREGRDQRRQACEDVFHWHGSAVNINPALFNFVVSAYECLTAAGIALMGKAFQEFEESYRLEEDNGHSHRVDGRISMHAGRVNRLLADLKGTKGL